MFKYVPNILTMFRFVLIPFIFISIIQSNYIAAFVLLTISGITDILDGFIARKFNFITNFGKLIDPLSDKATQLSVLAALCIENIIPLWILFVVFLKEIIMIAGASFLYGKELVVSSKWYGKLATVLFYIAIVSSFIVKYFEIDFHFDTYIYYLALFMTMFSLIMYFEAFYKQGYLKKENLKIVDKNKIDKNK